MLPFIDQLDMFSEPKNAFILGAAAAIIGMGFGFIVFRDVAAFPAIFIASIVAGPPIVDLLEEEGMGGTDGSVWRRHETLIEAYAYAFFGMTASFAAAYAVLPPGLVDILFASQLTQVAIGAFTFSSPIFIAIITNNLGLMLSFFLFSFFRGYGSFFLLTWNASVLGLLWGNAFRAATLSEMALKNVVLIWPYLLPEVMAYFLAAVAGGLLYFNMEDGLERIDYDAYTFLAFALFLVILAAFIETFVLGLL